VLWRVTTTLNYFKKWCYPLAYCSLLLRAIAPRQGAAWVATAVACICRLLQRLTAWLSRVRCSGWVRMLKLTRSIAGLCNDCWRWLMDPYTCGVQYRGNCFTLVEIECNGLNLPRQHALRFVVQYEAATA